MLGFSRREWRVLAPLSTAGFFEVYDVALLTPVSYTHLTLPTN